MFEALEASDGLGDLGSLNGVRQLIRRRPLETEELRVDGFVIRVPTLAETARVKAWLILRRNATRDYLDFAALADRIPPMPCTRSVNGSWSNDPSSP